MPTHAYLVSDVDRLFVRFGKLRGERVLVPHCSVEENEWLRVVVVLLARAGRAGLRVLDVNELDLLVGYAELLPQDEMKVTMEASDAGEAFVSFSEFLQKSADAKSPFFE